MFKGINLGLYSLFLGLLLSFKSYSISYDVERAKSLSTSKYWLRLVHYYNPLFGSLKSFNDQKEFFISPEGKYNPFKELIASIEAFGDSSRHFGRLKKHAQCTFPERYRYLKEQLRLNIEDVNCPDFKEWKQGLDVEKVSIIFSTAYANNPASLFGHTLIRLHKRNSNFLDYSVGFAADADFSGIGLEYIVFGLLGGYRGYFLIDPYSKKVTEYNNSESRDLWEYELNLTQVQIDRMVSHLWETYSAAGFDYFFIDENCSFHLLSLLEVANPDWELLTKFSTFTLPADTIKLLNNENALKKPVYAPSNLKKLNALLNSLNHEEMSEYKQIIEGQKAPEVAKYPKAIHAALTNLNYYKYKEGQDFKNTKREKLFRKTLLARSKVGKLEDPSILPSDKNNRPDLGHDASRVGLSIGRSFGEAYFGLNSRWLLHDLMNLDIGYEPFTDIRFFDLDIRYLKDSKKFNVKELTLFSMNSLYPFNSFDRKISWNFFSGTKRLLENDCLKCEVGHIEGGSGLALTYFQNKMAIFTLFNWVLQYSGRLPKNFRNGPKLMFGSIFQLGQRVKLGAIGNIFYDLNKAYRKNTHNLLDIVLTYHPARNWEIKAMYQNVLSINKSEAGLGMSFFY